MVTNARGDSQSRKRRSKKNSLDPGPSSGTKSLDASKDGPSNKIAAKTLTFREMAAATRNFRVGSLIGQGGFGRVYKGQLEGSNQVLMMCLLDHPNLVNLVGYCADGDQRLLVYEYMELGSVEDHLLEPMTDQTLDWNTRMKIAVGAAKGLEHLHDKASPPVIYRDLKFANNFAS